MHPFVQDRHLPVSFLVKLQYLTLDFKNAMRGYHYCDLCTTPPWARSRKEGLECFEFTRRGSAEIHVSGPDGTFVAPTLIVHYVTEHGYCPPPEFVQAVMAQDVLELRWRAANAELARVSQMQGREGSSPKTTSEP